MKVVIFSRYPADPGKPAGGIEAVTVVLAGALAQQDDMCVHVVTLEPQRDKRTVEKDGQVTIHRLPGTHWPQMVDILIGPGKRRLTRYILDLKPDVVHTHETYGLTLGPLPIPHVFTVHGFDHANIVADSARFARMRSPLWARLERHGLSRHRHIISITPYVKKMIEDMTQANIYDIDNPVDERFFNVDRCEEPGRILTVGWISERKNTLGSVKGFARALDRGVDGVLAIAGEPQDTAYYQRLIAYIDEKGLRDRIQFLGQISHAQLLQELAKASLFLLPSRQENAPMAIAEAMAIGVPVITSNCCGMPFMIREGKTGYLIDPDNYETLADRIAYLLTNSSLRVQMGESAQLDAKQRFHPEVVARKTIEVYQTLLRTGNQET